MKLKKSVAGFSLVETGLVCAMASLIAGLALYVYPNAVDNVVELAQAHGSPSGTASFSNTPVHGAGAFTAAPGVRSFSDDETLTDVQPIDTLPEATRPKDVAARGDWLYVVTDQHVLVNGPWADALCPASRAGRQALTPGKSLAAVRGILFQRQADKRRVHVRGVELATAVSTDAAGCIGVSVSHGTFRFLDKPVAFASDLNLPR